MNDNYAEQTGAYKAIAKMFAEAVVELEMATDEVETGWAMRRLHGLVSQLKDVEKEYNTTEEA